MDRDASAVVPLASASSHAEGEEAMSAKKLTRAELDRREDAVRNDEHVPDERQWYLQLDAHVRAQDDVLRSFEHVAALPADHELPLEHSCCAVSKAIAERCRAARMEE
jgi:hypothetical protein